MHATGAPIVPCWKLCALFLKLSGIPCLTLLCFQQLRVNRLQFIDTFVSEEGLVMLEQTPAVFAIVIHLAP